MKHFIDSLKDEVHITKRLPKKISGKASSNLLRMRPVSWSDEKYYLQQVLNLFIFSIEHLHLFLLLECLMQW